MIAPDLFTALPALVLSVLVGLLVHEWFHAATLRLAGVPCTIDYGPGRTDGSLLGLASRPWARVVPRPTGREPAWTFRVAALSPLALAVPVFVIAAAGVAPGSPATTAATIGWLACALPSPQDFSVAFYAHRHLASNEVDDSSRPTAALRGD